MFGMIRLLIISFLILSVVFVCLQFYALSVRKAKLRDWYKTGDRSIPIELYIQNGLRNYDRSLRRKLIWGVYIVPLAVMITVIYFINFA